MCVCLFVLVFFFLDWTSQQKFSDRVVPPPKVRSSYVAAAEKKILIHYRSGQKAERRQTPEVPAARVGGSGTRGGL